MSKKLDIGSKAFSQAIEGLPYTPNGVIVKRIDSKMFALDENKIYRYKPEYLAAKEFSAVCELFNRRFGNQVSSAEVRMKVLSLFDFISRKEAPFTKQLIEIAVEVITELYDVPDHLNLTAFIEPRIDLDTAQKKDPAPFLELSLQQKNSMRDEIQKRVLLNGLVHGSSMHIWKGIYYLVKEKIDKLNPILMGLYDEFTAGVNFEFWMMNPDAMGMTVENNTHITQGFNKIEFKTPGLPEAKVTCKAINFPSLLHELNKGVIDYLICHSIPANYTEDELRYYYDKADAYENEIWHYLLSPSLWSDLLEVADVDSREIPRVIMNLSRLSYETLNEIFRAMMDDKKKARIKLEVWKVI